MATRVIIVGAGIAGLTTAIALAREGIEVCVVERAQSLTPVGAGLVLWPNALAALSSLGLEETVRSIGIPVNEARVFSSAGRLLNGWNGFADILGCEPLVVLRAQLQHLLYEIARPTPVHFGASCERVHESGSQVTATVDGAHVRADILIAADGANSIIRRTLFPRCPIRDEGSSILRGVAYFGDGFPSLWLGRGLQFLMLPAPDARTHWSIISTKDSGEGTANLRLEALRKLSGWPSLLSSVVNATPAASISKARLNTSNTVHLHKGRVALIGDAAHAMTPDLGQGACQAIEDAIMVTKSLKSTSDMQAALEHYTQMRLRRVRRIQAMSHYVGKMLRSRGRITPSIRNWLIADVPHLLVASSLRELASQSTFYELYDKIH